MPDTCGRATITVVENDTDARQSTYWKIGHGMNEFWGGASIRFYGATNCKIIVDKKGSRSINLTVDWWHSTC